MTLFATFFHGEQVLFIFLGFAVVVLGVLSLLSWWLVKRFKPRLGRRAYGMGALPFVVAIAAVTALVWAESPNSGPPQALPGSEASRLVKGLPSYAPLGYSGLAYFKGKLYVSTNIGLLEVEGARISKIYRVQDEHSVVSGPWVDRENQLLGVRDDQTHELLNYNGSKWQRVPMPMPAKGYYSRGDVLAGGRLIGNQRGFWMVAGGSAWQWRPDTGSWTAEVAPPNILTLERMDETIGVLPVESKALFLVRHESLDFTFAQDEKFKSDTVKILDGDWRDLPAPDGLRFFAETLTVAGDAGYICTRSGSLLRVTAREIKAMELPGKCETVAATSSGTLLASFLGKGILEYDGSWKFRANHPYPSGAGKYWAHLAEDSSQIAYALNAQPVVDKERSTGSDYKWKQNAPTELWVSLERKPQRVEIP